MIGYTVEMLHYQSRPHLYVTGNLYRPSNSPGPAAAGSALRVWTFAPRPGGEQNGLPVARHLVFARHGYVCLALDSLELGEIAATHHGTYSEGRWWWQSRGYTPAGVECLNGIRGLDYLVGPVRR